MKCCHGVDDCCGKECWPYGQEEKGHCAHQREFAGQLYQPVEKVVKYPWDVLPAHPYSNKLCPLCHVLMRATTIYEHRFLRSTIPHGVLKCDNCRVVWPFGERSWYLEANKD